jgi:hypothetical protein
MSKNRDVASAMESRRGDVERNRDAVTQWFHCTGEIEVFGPGAACVDVVFPAYFVDKPRPSYGAELPPGEGVVAGNLPTCSVVVTQWGTRQMEDGTAVYSGATLAIVTTGPTGQTLIAHWHMEGRALRSPSES